MMAAQQFDLDPPAREELQPGAVGRLLRATREGYRQDIATVSQQLRIRSVYLKAIEDGNYQDLPGSTYAVGFVRSYAEYLGLDPQEIVRRFRDEDAEVNRRTKLVFPVPSAEAKVPSGALVLIALTLAVIAYGGWYYLSDRDRSLVDLVPSVPESLRDLVESDGTAETGAGDDAPTPTTATAAETDPAPASASAATTTATTVITPGADTETDAPAVGAASATAPATAASGASIETATGAAPESATDAAAMAAAETGADTGLASAAIDAATADAALEAPDTAAGSTDGAPSAAATSAASASDEAATAAVEPAGETAATATETATPPQQAAEQLAAIPEAPRVPESVQDGQSFGVAFGGSRVVIVARMESFLRVRDEAGNEIWSRLLRAGDRYLVPERDGLTLSVGNAGGIDIFVDGTKAPALGAVGVGVTGISLDPQRLRSGTALP